MDLTKLEGGLENLRGLDFELAESRERAAGNNFVDVTFTKSFQAQLAAMALGVPVEDIKELPIKQYSNVCARVFGFLVTNSAEKIPSTNSENSV